MRVLASVLLAVSIGACGAQTISRERGIELATPHAPSDATIEGAALVQLRQFGEAGSLGGRSLDDQVWAVLFNTVLGNPCPIDASGSPASGCPVHVPATLTVVLDGRTGDFLFAVSPVP